MEISSLLDKYRIPTQEKLPKSERAELLGQIYEHYEKSWKKNTWTNYIKWLKEQKKKNTKDNQALFKKSKSYFKKDTIKTFCSFRLGHVKTNDLYYILSQAKDKDNRGENFNLWLFANLKLTPSVSTVKV